LIALQQKAAKAEENCLRRRQSLPAVPAALLIPASGRISNGTNKIDEDEVFTSSSSGDSPKNSKHKMPKEKSERRSSVAALRRDSCKIS